MEMTPRAHIAIAAVLLGCVLFIFVSPVLNLPWTTLQSSRQAGCAVLLVAMLACAGILAAILRPVGSAWRCAPVPALQSESLIDITCTRRC
jgi:hypothetical protein